MKKIKILTLLNRNVNWKVCQDGYKYPQNSTTPFFSYYFTHYRYNFKFSTTYILESDELISNILTTEYTDHRCLSRHVCLELIEHALETERYNLFIFVGKQDTKVGKEFFRDGTLSFLVFLDETLSFLVFHDYWSINILNGVFFRDETISFLVFHDYWSIKGVFNENGDRMLPISRSMTLLEIRIRLLREGIESNPGPEPETLKIITVNCNGLTSDQRLLQAIGKIKRNIKLKDAIIFLQETHNANLELIENLWQGNVNIAAGTGGSRGVITLSTKNLKVI